MGPSYQPTQEHTQVAPSVRIAARLSAAGRGASRARRGLSAVVAVVACATAIDAAAQAPSPLDTAIAGSLLAGLPAALADSSGHAYELVRSESDNIRSAIDLSVAHMNFIVRPIARRRLMKANRLAEHITFAVSPDTVTVTFDGMNPIVTPRDGGAASWVRGETRERYDVHIESAGDTLRQVIATDDGQRENDFEFLDKGERIALHVVLTAERLPMPLRYTLMYRRLATSD